MAIMCARCGGQIDEQFQFCPRCGAPKPGAPPPSTPPPTSFGQSSATYAIASLVLGILGLFGLFLVGPILAIVFANVSRDRGESQQEMANIGRVLGCIALVFNALMILGWMIFGSCLFFSFPWRH